MSQMKQIHEALLSAYPSRNNLSMMLRFEMDLNLDEIVGNANQSTTVFDLITWAQAHGRLDELVAAAKKDVPGNAKLQALSGGEPNSAYQSAPPAPQPASFGQTESEKDDGDGYDVFISYSHKDGTWVSNVLLQRLEQAGLRVCIDERDFEIGVPSLINMEQAIERSRHTLLVMTPNWINSEWTEFESLLVQTQDPSGRLRRLIPMMREQCKPPSRIAMLTYADFTGLDSTLPWDRLIRAMKR